MKRSAATLAASCLSAGTLFAQTPEKVPLPVSAVTASTHDGNLPGHTVDGSLNSRWSGYGDGAWIRYDLGATRTIAQVRIAAYRGNERRNRFDLQVSDTGTSWLTVWTGTSSGMTVGLETFPMNDARGRYVRYLGHGYTGGTAGLWNSLTEVEVYARPQPPAPPTGLRPQTGNGEVLLTWNAVAGASGYDVGRRVADCGPETIIAQVPAVSPPAYLDTAVTEDERYLYTVRARTPSGSTGPSAPVAITPGRRGPSITRLTATAGAPGSARVSLWWEPVFTATRYTVYRASTSTACPSCGLGGFSPLATVAAPSTAYVDTTATPGLTFAYRVVAANEHGSGDVSNTAQVFSSYATPTPRPIGPTPTPCGCPAPTPTPGPITAAPAAVATTLTPGASRVQVAWWISDYRVPNRAFTYTVLRGDSACGPFQKVAQVTSPQGGTVQGTYVDTGLTNGRTYYYLVVGTNPMGDSTNTTGTPATPVAVLPSPPSGPVNTFVYQSPSPLAVEVIWKEVWDADSYTVKRSLASGGPYATIATGVVKRPNFSAVTYDDPNVQYQTAYYYVVTAVNTAGESAPSAEGSADTGPPPLLPPANLVAAATGSAGDVQLSWEASPGATAYSCRYGRQPGGPYDENLPLAYAPQTGLLAHYLVNDVRHYFTCHAIGAGGTSGPSNEASALPFGPFGAPVGVAVGEVTAPDRRCLQVTWHRVSGAAGYHVDRAGDAGGPFSRLGSVPDLYYDDCTAALDTTYYYRVRAYSSSAESGPSAIVSGRLPSEVLVTPPGSTAIASTHDGNVPANTVDNDLSTRWSGSGDGAWIQWDLGTVRNVSSVRIAVYRGDERKNRFDLLVSADGVTWTVLAVGATTSGTTTAQETYDLSDTPARYVRCVGHGARLNAGGTTSWNSVTEVDIYEMPR